MALIRARPLFGHGLDTLAYAYPQTHPQKYASVGSLTGWTAKPHNWYLAIAYGTDLVGLGSLLALLLLHLWRTYSRGKGGTSPCRTRLAPWMKTSTACSRVGLLISRQCCAARSY